jgi:DNA-binding transcriptional LysR family regulator
MELRHLRYFVVIAERIGCVPSGFLDFLPSVLPAFRERAPTVRTMVYELSTSAQCDQIRLGQLDVGVVRNPIPAGAESTCGSTRSFLDLAPVVSTNGYDPGPGTEPNGGQGR